MGPPDTGATTTAGAASPVSVEMSSTIVVPPGTVTGFSVRVDPTVVGKIETTIWASAPGAESTSSVRRCGAISPPATTVGPDNGDAAAVNAKSDAPVASSGSAEMPPTTTGSVELTMTAAASVCSTGSSVMSVTAPAVTGTDANSVGSNEPSAVTTVSETVASRSPGSATMSRREPASPKIPGTICDFAGAPVGGSQSTPSGIEPFSASSRNAGTTRPAVATTCTTPTVNPGST